MIAVITAIVSLVVCTVFFVLAAIVISYGLSVHPEGFHASEAAHREQSRLRNLENEANREIQRLFPKVLLAVPDEHRLDECLRVLERLPHEAAQLVVVVLHHEAAALLASGGPSYRA